MTPEQHAKAIADAAEQYAYAYSIDDFKDRSKAFEVLQDAIWAGVSAAPEEWQPIETAPQDGTVFLGYRDGKVREAHRVQRDDCEMWVFGGSSGSVEVAPQLKPTHWMPLPAAPKP